MKHAPVRPNFLVVGAAKCGTSSIYQYLKQHPEVFLPSRKEPNFFVGDPWHFSQVTAAEYTGMFAHAGSAKAVGEASVAYLYDRHAPDAILRHLGPATRIVVILRNPVDMAYSLWGHMVRAGGESLGFMEALRAEPARIGDEGFRRNAITWWCNYAYADRARYTAQVKRYLSRFGPDRVRVFVFEEFFADPRSQFAELCHFLAIADTFVPEFLVHNPTDEPRSMLLQRALQHRQPWKEAFKPLMPAPARTWLKSRIFRWNRTRRKALSPLSPETRATIWNLFEQDVEELERLLGRALRPVWAPNRGADRLRTATTGSGDELEGGIRC